MAASSQDEKSNLEPEQLSSWMAAAQAGDAETYERLLREILPVVRMIVRIRLADSSSVEDVVQNVLISVHRARSTYRPEQPFMPWLRAITRNAITDFLRASGRQREREVALDEEYAGVDPDSRDPLLSAELRRALDALPPAQRTAVELLQLSELSVADAASKVGVSPSALKVRAHRGYRALREILRRRSVDEP